MKTEGFISVPDAKVLPIMAGQAWRQMCEVPSHNAYAVRKQTEKACTPQPFPFLKLQSVLVSFCQLDTN